MTLNELLNGVGKKIFIEYIHLFKDTEISNIDIVEQLPKKYTRESRTSRTSKARTILKEYGLKEALINIKNSKKLSSEIIDKTNNLLKEIVTKVDTNIPDTITKEMIINADEIKHNEKYLEGSVKSVKVNKYERDKNARDKCILFYGAICEVCRFDFEKIYGEIGVGFIHVHHIKQLSEIKEEYEVDPINDLIPLCPNCHAMIHKKQPALSIENLKSLISIKNR